MKKKLFCLLLLLVLPVCLLFTGCDSSIETVDSNTSQHLFISIDSFVTDDGYRCHILVHKETRIMYFVQNKGGITVMYDVDGKPLIYEGEL